MDSKSIGSVITNRRKEIGITQAMLSEYTDLSKNTIYKIERGQANPSLNVLNKILDVLGMELKLVIKDIRA